MPAIIAAVTDAHGEVMAIQRIWLRPDRNGKALVAPAKATLGPMRDGAVRLGDVGPEFIRTIGLAEGIETALSARQLFSLPTWAVLGCSRLSSVALPPNIEHVVIFADQGEAGMTAAGKAAQVYGASGLVCDVEAPPADDWNVYLQARAAA
jgi:DNA primase